MGYGEYGGGGSVRWLVIHGDDKKPRHDKDTHPNSGGDFKVVVKAASNKTEAKARTTFGNDGTVTIDFPIADDAQQIRLYWPEDA